MWGHFTVYNPLCISQQAMEVDSPPSAAPVAKEETSPAVSSACVNGALNGSGVSGANGGSSSGGEDFTEIPSPPPDNGDIVIGSEDWHRELPAVSTIISHHSLS